MLTFIGYITRGFDFLGYWFSPSGLGIARKTVARMLDKLFRLYEQGADHCRIETYLKHWWRWVRSGVGEVFVRVVVWGCWVSSPQPNLQERSHWY